MKHCSMGQSKTTCPAELTASATFKFGSRLLSVNPSRFALPLNQRFNCARADHESSQNLKTLQRIGGASFIATREAFRVPRQHPEPGGLPVASNTALLRSGRCGGPCPQRSG